MSAELLPPDPDDATGAVDPTPGPPAGGPGDDELPELAAVLRVELGRLNRQLRQHGVGGLTPSQLSALAALDRHGSLRLGELARVEAGSPPTLTKVVGGLEAEGYVTRTPDPDATRRHLTGMIPLGRIGTVDDVAAAALFLASDEASFITGVALPIDGGALCR
jgi:hypothetical protein